MKEKIIAYFRCMPEWMFISIYLGSLFLYKLIIGLQGFDMCDEGFVLSAYQQIFNDPSSCSYQFMYYNALPVGGLWNMLFGALGIYGFRILSALCSIAIACIVYSLLRKDINRWCIFLGIWIFNLGYVMVFHHNWLTALFVAFAALCLYKGLTSKNKWWVLLAGVVVGVNIFTRIPNVSMFALSLVFIPYYLYSKDIRATLTLLGMAVLGVLIGIGCELAFMYSMGHLPILVDSITYGLSSISSADSTHGLSKLFAIYKWNYRDVYMQLGIFISVPLLAYIINRLNSNDLPKWLRWLFYFGYFVLIWKCANLTFMIYAASYLIFVLYILRHPQEERIIYLITIATIELFFLPFGSDYGIGNMGENCIWIASPLTMGLSYVLLKEKEIQYGYARKLMFVFVLALMSRALYDMSLNCYFDSGSRLKKTHKPHTELATTYTTEFKAAQIDTLLVHLHPLVKKNDYLLCYQHIPMVNYLTETRPYLGTSWPAAYTSDVLARQLTKAPTNIPILPVIVRNKSAIAKWHMYNKDWDNLSAADQWNFNTRKIELIQEFIRDNGYQIVWENELFQILTPNKREDI